MRGATEGPTQALALDAADPPLPIYLYLAHRAEIPPRSSSLSIIHYSPPLLAPPPHSRSHDPTISLRPSDRVLLDRNPNTETSAAYLFAEKPNVYTEIHHGCPTYHARLT